MLGGDYLILVSMGGIFLLLGTVLVARSRVGRQSRDNNISVGHDVKGYLEYEPEHPEALMIGGWIAVVLGLFLVVLAVGFWLWG